MFKSIVISWDFICSILVAILFYIIYPNYIDNNFAKDLYGVGISVLSIVFSIFFAALAIIISTSDDEFVIFLEEEGHYTHLINTFKITLLISFCALVYSIISYIITSNCIVLTTKSQPSSYFSAFVFLFFYSLTSTFNACLDSIKYSQFRSQYLIAKKSKNI